MGLDQYAYKHKPNQSEQAEEIACWRKHNALQGWMANLFELKTGEKDMNCQEFYLEMQDLEMLEIAVLNNNLPQTQGFFFGSDTRDDDYQKRKTMEFIMEAKLALSEGYEVFYGASW